MSLAKSLPIIDDLTADQLKAIMPHCDAPLWHPLLVAAMGRWGIVTPTRVTCFLAQVAHESGECRRLEEGLSYAAERLMVVWPARFPTLESAKPYARAPEALANHVYANRLGNGDASSGDGWRYRGGGLVQLTGRENYQAAELGTTFNLIGRPEQLRVPGQAAAQTAGWFWQSKGCNELADACLSDTVEPFKTLTRRINGGLVGLDERLTYWRKAIAALAT